MWYRLQEILYAWYEEIQNDILNAKVMHADETGWRVRGKTWWLWCFTTGDATYYMIERCRGRPVLLKFFKREFQGILVSDFWGPYNAVKCLAKQKCIPRIFCVSCCAASRSTKKRAARGNGSAKSCVGSCVMRFG